MGYLRAVALLVLAIAALAPACAELDGGRSSGGGGDTVSAGSAGSSPPGGGIPTTCAEADHGIGCCTPGGVLYYCTTEATVFQKTCAAGTVCGWSGTESDYDCVAPPGGADPSSTYPLLCEAGSSSASSTSGAPSSSTSGTPSSSASGASSSSASSGGTVTWTTLYDTIFGPSGTSSCTLAADCHGTNQSGFTCGTTQATCYAGMVQKGLITPGASASSSELVTPKVSPLCGSLGGDMPLAGACVTAAQLTEIEAWLAGGAPDD